MSSARWLSLALTAAAAFGCGGSIRPAVLIASARAAYPDCEDVRIAERADGVRQWIVVCGERRLFGLRSQEAIARDRREQTRQDDETIDALLEDQSPPIRWGAAVRADEAPISRVVASLQPLRVDVSLVGIGDVEGSSYFTVESPRRASCAARPELYVGDQPLALRSAPTESASETRLLFARRIDRATLRLLASSPFEISYCGRRHALDDATADAFRAWAAGRVEP